MTAAGKAYRQRLHGLKGLNRYGVDGELISIKCRVEGGRCLLLKDIQAGHIYREKFPYPVTNDFLPNSRLPVAELFFEGEAKRLLIERLKAHYGETLFNGICSKMDRDMIKNEKKYLQSISRNDLSFFLFDCFTAYALNRRMKKKGLSTGKFSSNRFFKMITRFITCAAGIIFCCIIDRYVPVDIQTLHPANRLTLPVCIGTGISILENAATESDEPLAVLIQKVPVSKAERHLDVDINNDGKTGNGDIAETGARHDFVQSQFPAGD